MKRIYLSLICILAASVLADPAQALFVTTDESPIIANPQSPADRYYRLGIENIAKGKFSDAQKNFEKSVQADPTMIKAILGLAEAHLNQGHKEEVANILKDALASNHPRVHLAWARFLYLEKKMDEAKAAFLKTLEVEPGLVDAMIDLGDLHLNIYRDAAKAEDYYRSALERDPLRAGAHYALAIALESLKRDHTQVEAELMEANRLQPHNPLPLNALAQLYIRRNDSAKALETLSNLIDLQPKFADAYLDRGDIYLENNDTDKALADYKKALDVDSTKPAATYTKIGMVHQIRKEWKQAKDAYRRAIERDPGAGSVFAYNNLAWVTMESGENIKEALSAAQKAVDLRPGVAQFWDTLGWLYRIQGNKDKATEALEKSLTLPDAGPEMYYHLGVVYTEAGKTQEALAALQKALSFQKNFDGLEDAQKRAALLQNSL